MCVAVLPLADVSFRQTEHAGPMDGPCARSDRGPFSCLVDVTAFHRLTPGSQQVSIFCKDGINGEVHDVPMKRMAFLLIVVGTLAGAAAFYAPTLGHADDAAVPIFGGSPPPGYRDWRLISVAHEEGNLNDLRAILGNDIAIKAYREDKLPFPDGTIIARLAWSYVPSEENNKVFGRAQSFVAGTPKNGVQFMVKDSKKYAATGGWGFAEFINGKPAGEAVIKTCYPCHEPIKARDFVFTQYAP
jgi:Cytochrome P460